MIKKYFALLLFCIAADALASSAAPSVPPEPPIQNVSEVIGTALANPAVAHFAVLVGPEADKIRATTNSAGGEVRVAAKVVKTFKGQPGCGRVEVRMIIPNVRTNEGQTIPYWGQNIAMNICKNGYPPAQADDVTVPPIR